MRKSWGIAAGLFMACASAFSAGSKLELNIYAQDSGTGAWGVQHAYTLTDTSGHFSCSPCYPGGAQVTYGNSSDPNPYDPIMVVMMFTAPPLRAPLAVGHYADALRAPFAGGSPGMDIAIDSTGQNALNGFFDV